MINFLSLTEYPTRKAYGVTLSGTCTAACEAGFQTRIISPNYSPVTRFGSSRVLKCMRYLRKLYGGVPAVISKVAFAAHRTLFYQFIRHEFDFDKTDIFWVRDAKLAKFLSKEYPECRIVLEIHQIQSRTELSKLCSLPNNVILGPISEAIINQLVDLRSTKTIVQLPMGVSNYFFSTNFADQGEPEYDIGYFGSFRSSGHDQGIENVLTQLIPRLKTDTTFKLMFVGLGAEGVSVLRKIASDADVENQICLVEYSDHDKMPSEMIRCKSLLLPYPEGEYFESRFPIKALEYGAIQRPILCSRTKSHQFIFSDENVWFYDYGDPEGILKAYNQVHVDPRVTLQKIQCTFNLAQNHTYTERINRIKAYIL